jgi:hypothetical protein
MPGRQVAITVILENDVPGGAVHALALPTGLDLVWTLSYASSGSEQGGVRAGVTVFVTVTRAPGAYTAAFGGITLSPYAEVSELGEGSGLFSFTMPDSDASLTLDAQYSPIAIREQAGPSASPVVKLTYTRDEMLEKAQGPVYYSGWSSEVDPMVGRADKAVLVTTLLEDAGISFEPGDTLKLSCIDGFTYEYAFEDLMGEPRYYYPDILLGSDAGKAPLAPLLVVKGNAVTGSSGVAIDDAAGDMLNTYRFIFGQTEGEYTGHVAAGSRQPKHVTAITVIKPLGNEEGGTGDVDAAVWDGKSLDIRWFSDDPDAADFYISTPAAFAGLAALVNGLYNDEIDTIVGDTGGFIHANVGQGGAEPGSSNLSTATYHYGDYDFTGKTVHLTADIDMGEANYMPIGGQYLMRYNDPETKLSSSFCGTLDGQGHIVTVNCDRWAFAYGDGQSVGLIGRLGVHENDPVDTRPVRPVVKDLAVAGSIRGNRSVGGIVGKIGVSVEGGSIEGCANYASVTSTDAKGVGGIVGAAWYGGRISDCYNAGEITGVHLSPVGGIAGSCEIPIENCYNIGTITGPVNYAMALGTDNGGAPVPANSYYLEGSAADGGWYTARTFVNTGSRTAAEMRSAAFVATLGAAFKSVPEWNGGYPVLAWMSHDPTIPEGPGPEAGVPGSGDIDGDGHVTMLDLIVLLPVASGQGAALSPAQAAAADMDSDGSLTMSDLVLMVQRVLGM